jgi:oligopeptide transport system permease protein
VIAYVIQRLLWMIPVLFFIAAITFGLMHAVPGGPWDRQKRLPPQAQANVEAKYGLDKPVFVPSGRIWEPEFWRELPDTQFSNYIGGLLRPFAGLPDTRFGDPELTPPFFGLVRLHIEDPDLGVSYRQLNRPVSDILLDGARISATLGFIALVLSTAVGMGFGILSALRQNSWIDYACVAFATFGAAVPNFVLGLLLMVIFTVHLHWLPSSGWKDPNVFLFLSIPSDWKQMVMPVVALSVLPAAYIARVARASVLEVLEQDYVRTARSKGLAEQVVVMRHMVRNALIPVLTILGPVAAFLVTGSFIIEYLFAIPGIGRQFVTSISARDYGVIMGTTLFYAVVVATANLIVDLMYAVVDPRIRY